MKPSRRGMVGSSRGQKPRRMRPKERMHHLEQRVALLERATEIAIGIHDNELDGLRRELRTAMKLLGWEHREKDEEDEEEDEPINPPISDPLEYIR